MGSWWSIPVDPTVINEPELNIQAQVYYQHNNNNNKKKKKKEY